MFQHCWMPAETWVELINHYYKPPTSLILDSKNLLNAIARTKWFQTALETTGLIDNDLCIYKNRYRPNGGKQTYCFYSAPSGAKPTVKEKPWFTYINYAEDLLKTKVTRTNTLQLAINPPPIPSAGSVHTRKRKKPQNHENNENEWNPKTPLEEFKEFPSSLEVSSLAPSASSVQPPPKLITDPLLYWHSTEAAKLFLPAANEENCLVAIDNQISVLEEAISAPLSYLVVVDFIGEPADDPSELLTDYQVWSIRQKCHILLCVLKIARKEMPTIQNWDAVCAQALKIVNNIGFSITTASRVVRNYYQDFRRKRKFQVKLLQKHNLPPFLEQNKDICTALQQYAREHLSELSVELICEYLDETVLPKMVKERTGMEKGKFVSEEYESKVKSLRRIDGGKIMSFL